MTEKLEITPLTRIGELLDSYPELEELLIADAPVFEKLRNPILRRTVAKVTTVQRAASVAGIDVRELVAKLRRAVGQRVDRTISSASAPVEEPTDRWPAPPAWIDSAKVALTIDADALLGIGEVPASRITQAARGLDTRQLLLVTSTFRPVPLLELLERQGFRVFLRQTGPERFETFVLTPDRPDR